MMLNFMPKSKAQTFLQSAAEDPVQIGKQFTHGRLQKEDQLSLEKLAIANVGRQDAKKASRRECF
jgi:hypothetical protein